MLWFLSALALAAPTDRYPWQAPVDLPATGVVRIAVPPSLRSADDPADGRDLLLLDADGQSVPFAVLRGQSPTHATPFVVGTEDSPAALVTWPDDTPDTWWIRVAERPVDGLVVQVHDTPAAVDVVVEERRGDALVEVSRGLVWRVADASELAVDLPPVLGTFRVTLEAHTPISRAPTLMALRRDGVDLPDAELRAPVVTTRVQEDGWTRYDVLLDQRWPIDWVQPDPTEDLFQRAAAVVAPSPSTVPGQLPWLPGPSATGTLERLQLGGARIDRTRLPAPDRHGVRLSLLVDDRGRTPLDVPDVVVGMRGREIVVRDPGPGPHTLYAGASDARARPSDLQFATPELVRLASGPVQPGARAANPDHQPPEVRGGLGLPGVPLERDRSTWGRPVTGEGLTRVPLDSHVLANARADLGDLRLLTPDGRQVPYLLQSVGYRPGWDDLPMERRERDGKSVIEVALPEANATIGTVTLTTEAPLFSRRVRLSVPRGGVLQTLRAVQWVGADRPSSLTVDLHQRLGDTLVVEVDNGDDPPLPIGTVSVDLPAWELVAVLPPEGATLRYGDRRRDPPDHDLMLVDDLPLRAQTEASLGEPQALSGPPVAWFDRVVVLGGIGVLAVGMLVLTGLLVRGAPVADEEEEPEDDAPEPAEPDAPEPDAPEAPEGDDPTEA